MSRIGSSSKPGLKVGMNLRSIFLEMIKKNWQNENYSFTWLAPALGKVSHMSIGKRRDESCLCISLNLWIHWVVRLQQNLGQFAQAMILCLASHESWTWFTLFWFSFHFGHEGESLLIPTTVRRSQEAGSAEIPFKGKLLNRAETHLLYHMWTQI